jgi:hypothetical protein
MGKLYLLLSEQNNQRAVIDILVKISELNMEKFENMILNTINFNNVEGIKLFSEFWKLLYEFKPDSEMFKSGKCIYTMVDYLSDPNPLLRHLSKTWLNQVNQRFSNSSNMIKMRNTYNSARPKSSLYYSEKNNNKSVYQRLYDQNKEKIKRQEERIKEDINKIKDRANHPIQKRTNLFNNFRNNKKNKINNNNNSNNGFNHNIYSNKYKITYEGEKPNFSDKNYVSKKIDEVLFNRSSKGSTKYTEKKKNNNLNDEQKRKDGKNFIDNQRKCIELFNDMIEKEEKRGNKIFNEIEKERMFKDLLNKLYDEMNNSNKIKNIDNNINEDEDEKISEYNDNDNYKKICNSVEIKLNNN